MNPGMDVGAHRRAAPLAVLPALPLFLTFALAAPAQGPRTYEVQPEESSVRIHVGTAGLFSFLGHEHLIEGHPSRGRVRWDPQAPERSEVELEFRTESLRVVDPELEEDKRAKIQADMETKVLEIDKHPTIVFTSTRFQAEERGIVAGEPFGGTLEGMLILHGVSRALQIPVRVTLGSTELRGSGEVTIQGSRFGIEPVRAGGGTVKTKDALRITLDLVARPDPE